MAAGPLEDGDDPFLITDLSIYAGGEVCFYPGGRARLPVPPALRYGFIPFLSPSRDWRPAGIRKGGKNHLGNDVFVVFSVGAAATADS